MASKFYFTGRAGRWRRGIHQPRQVCPAALRWASRLRGAGRWQRVSARARAKLWPAHSQGPCGAAGARAEAVEAAAWRSDFLATIAPALAYSCLCPCAWANISSLRDRYLEDSGETAHGWCANVDPHDVGSLFDGTAACFYTCVNRTLPVCSVWARDFSHES